jgi:hypothetical protein
VTTTTMPEDFPRELADLWRKLEHHPAVAGGEMTPLALLHRMTEYLHFWSSHERDADMRIVCRDSRCDGKHPRV